METEIWKDIPDYKGYYQVSNFGRVKSLSRIKMNKGVGIQYTSDRIIKQGLSKGYFSVFLYKDKTRKSFSVHVLVAICFLGHKPGRHLGIVVDHVNNIKTDNMVTNLQLISYSKNRSKDIVRDLPTGVTIDNSMKKKYCARIRHNGEYKKLGYFYTQEEAGEAYSNAYFMIHGYR